MKRIVKFVGLNLILILIDQFTKYLAQAKLMGNDGISIIDGVFKLHYLENRGAAFGIFQGKISWFVIMTAIVYIVILYAYFKLPNDRKYIPLQYIMIFISAGAIGNFIDRIVNNYVIDFLYFELINFPIFNLADCYVTISAAVFLILGIFYYKDEDYNFLKWKKDVSNGK